MPNINTMRESKYLKKEDLDERGNLVTITAVEKEDVSLEEQPSEYKWIMRFKEFEKGMVMNWTNLQLCAKATGSEATEDWPGKKIVLYVDDNVSFGGKLVGGIRIRAAKGKPTPAPVAEEYDELNPPPDDTIPF